ncbi:MAG: PilZ domain-containing protein [Desulfuromonadales bacterium]|nr:PilZ domain-containing protein [Desulfuromonadales bacterium]
MKCLLLADNRATLIATLEPILKHWGYRVVAAGSVQELATFLKESSPAMLIAGEKLLVEAGLQESLGKELPIVALRQNETGAPRVAIAETLDVPVDLFALFSTIQRLVEQHPRQNLRLRVQLPGMYKTGDLNDYILADVLSLSTQGLFFKSPLRVKQGDQIAVVFPLLGHCQEIEIPSRVLYVVEPQLSNNYMQGFGVGFDPLDQQSEICLRAYIEEQLLNQVAVHQDGVTDPSALQTVAEKRSQTTGPDA